MALTPLAPRLRGYRVVMASASPRRKEILVLAVLFRGVSFDVIPSAFEERPPAGATPRAEDHARDMAVGKALEVATRADEADSETPRLVIGADTLVEVDGLILGKPVDKEDANQMLRRLSGRKPRVITGVAVVIARGGECTMSSPERDSKAILKDEGPEEEQTSGGSGALAREAARLYPSSTVTVFNTPEVVRSQLRPPTEEEEEAGLRVRFVAGDFFREPLPPADLYVLARVLHDWGDAACEDLLRRVHRAGGPGGAVLLVERVLAAGGAGPKDTLLLSLNMLLQTRGRERTEAEYREIAARAGFPRLRLCRPGGPYDAMLARKWRPGDRK